MDAPLDMRYDVSEGKPSVWDILQTITRQELARVIHEYGELWKSGGCMSV